MRDCIQVRCTHKAAKAHLCYFTLYFQVISCMFLPRSTFVKFESNFLSTYPQTNVLNSQLSTINSLYTLIASHGVTKTIPDDIVDR